jgi:hypothetical protein
MCVADFLSNYIGLLGPDGCTIGTATVKGFVSDPTTGGVEISETNIRVVPSSPQVGVLQLAFEFLTPVIAGPGDLLGNLIGYSVTGLSPFRAELEMAGSAAGPPDGVVTVVEDLCLGGSFAPFPACTGTPQTLIAVHDSIGAFPTAVASFPRIDSFFDVFVDIAVDGGLAGTASLVGPVTTRAVPEPASMLLLTSGLAGIWAWRRRWA